MRTRITDRHASDLILRYTYYHLLRKAYTMTTIGHAAVDSGQLIIIDPCYIWNDDFAPGAAPTGGPYDAACRVTLGEDGFGELAGGVVFRTTGGDGYFQVRAEKNDDGRVLRIIIDLDVDDEDEA